MFNTYTVDYKIEAEYRKEKGQLLSLTWLNDKGECEAPDGLPSTIYYYPSGNIQRLVWHKAGKRHRENDLPADITFFDTSKGDIQYATWFWQGLEHREGDLPSCIGIDDADGRVCVLQFCRHGEECGIEGMPYYVWITPEGQTEDEDGNPLDVDLSRLSRYHGDLPRPPPVIHPPIFQFD